MSELQRNSLARYHTTGRYALGDFSLSQNRLHFHEYLIHVDIPWVLCLHKKQSMLILENQHGLLRVHTIRLFKPWTCPSTHLLLFLQSIFYIYYPFNVILSLEK